jgi:PAS domain S-box-containing protein
MATIDNEGHFTEVNENLVRVTGQDKTHLIGSPFSLTLAGDDAEARREQIMTGLHNHRIWRGELRHQTKEGNPFWTQSFFIPFNHHSGRLTHAILIYTDITERKRSEEATLRREEYLRSLVQSQSSYLIRTDLEGKFTFVNRRFEEKFSFLTDTFIGHPYMNTIDPGDFEACQQMAMTCITEPGKIVPLQIRKPTPDGGYYYTDWEFVGIQNEKGEVEEIQGIGQDATERLRNQRHILSQNKRLRQIAWTSSHELRRPVANIMGLVSLIKASQCCEDGFVDPLEVSIMALDDIIRDIVQKTYEAEEEAQNIKDQSDQP